MRRKNGWMYAQVLAAALVVVPVGAKACGMDAPTAPTVGLDQNENMTLLVGTLKMESGDEGTKIVSTVRCMDYEYKKHQDQLLDVAEKICDPTQMVDVTFGAGTEKLTEAEGKKKVEEFCHGAQRKFSDRTFGNG